MRLKGSVSQSAGAAAAAARGPQQRDDQQESAGRHQAPFDDKKKLQTEDRLGGHAVDPPAPTVGTREAPVRRQAWRAEQLDAQCARQELEAAGTDLTGILEVIERSAERFDEKTLVAALRQLAGACEHLGPGDSRRQYLHRTRPFQTLISMLVVGSERLDADSVASTIAALGRLGYRDELALDQLARAVAGSVATLDAKPLAELAEGLAALQHSPSIVLLHAVRKRLAQLMKGGAIDGRLQADIHRALANLGYNEKDASQRPNPPSVQQSDREVDYV